MSDSPIYSDPKIDDYWIVCGYVDYFFKDGGGSRF